MDYHKILKVPPNATKEEIRKAYRSFAFHFHPDRSKYDAALFLVVQEAYQALMKLQGENAEQTSDMPVQETTPIPEPEPKREARHDMSFVAGHIRRAEVWGPDFHMLGKPKIQVESYPCPACEGRGNIRNKFNLHLGCPRCKGSRLVTKVII